MHLRKRTPEEMIAYALEMTPELVPYAHELLADLSELGTSADHVVHAISSLDVPREARALDLGCGKGAVALAIAQRLGWRVFGLDLYEPFIAHCRRAAAAAGLSDRCRFGHGNILTLERDYPDEVPANVAVFGALGDVLGPLADTVRRLREYVTPGGFLVVADDYVREGGSTKFPRFEQYASRDETIRRLESHGDRVVSVVESPGTEGAETLAADNRGIRDRAHALAERYPHLREAFLAYAAEQEAEGEFLEANMVSAVWIVRRAPAVR